MHNDVVHMNVNELKGAALRDQFLVETGWVRCSQWMPTGGPFWGVQKTDCGHEDCYPEQCPPAIHTDIGLAMRELLAVPAHSMDIDYTAGVVRVRLFIKGGNDDYCGCIHTIRGWADPSTQNPEHRLCEAILRCLIMVARQEGK